MKQADIIGHTKHDLKGNLEQITYEWDGPKSGFVRISYELLAEGISDSVPLQMFDTVGKTMQIGPFKLRCFEYNPTSNTYDFVRINSFIGNVNAIVYRLTRWLDLIYRRLIITASIWKLADYNPAAIPPWRDLYIAQRYGDEKREDKEPVTRPDNSVIYRALRGVKE